jgi:hypothetical protein
MSTQHKFYCGLHSVHIAKSFGVRFEIEKLGGMAVHYGHPWKTWYLVIDIGVKSYCVGITQLGQPKNGGPR